MKRIFVYVFVGIIALVLIVVTLLGFNPAVEKWTSLVAGIALGLFLVKLPVIFHYVKKTLAKKN